MGHARVKGRKDVSYLKQGLRIKTVILGAAFFFQLKIDRRDSDGIPFNLLTTTESCNEYNERKISKNQEQLFQLEVNSNQTFFYSGLTSNIIHTFANKGQQFAKWNYSKLILTQKRNTLHEIKQQ